MGITLKDIYNQREMLRRGEEIARAAKQAEERERLRDHFAAAALTGLLHHDAAIARDDTMARKAYELADAMLRVRDSRAADTANHDASPEAIAVSTDDRTDKAATSQCRDRPGDTPVTEPMPKEKLAEVSDRTDPVPYSQTYENLGFAPTKRDTTPTRNGTPQDGSLQGEGSVPDSRNANEPVAWAVMVGGQRMCVSWCKEMCEEQAYYHRHPCGDSVLIVPLYRHPQPTLTDAEREAVDMAIDLLNGVEDVSAGASSRADAAAATLRGLLERMK